MDKANASHSHTASQAVAHHVSPAGNNGVALPAPAQFSVAPIQMVTVHSTGSEASPSYDFTIVKADLGKGTATSQGTRDFVNGWSAVPKNVNYSYDIMDVSNGDTVVVSDAGTSPNPPDHVGRPWDAGHSLGRQNGGLGDDDGWVFPQNPSFNRGNNYFGAKTYKDWRYCENVFHDHVSDYGKGRWKVWLT